MAKDVKKCIRDFINHVNSLEEEEDPESEGNGFNREYRLIQEAQLKNRRDNAFSMEAGRKDNNVRKNRYKDILPYDDHRVILREIEGEEDSDYINASKMMGVRGTGGYIGSQGPLAATVNDFWRMVWEYNVEIIFMACRIVELGKIKCKQYWNDEGKSDDFGDFTVYTEKEEELSSDFIRRQFKVTYEGEERYVTQFHYSGWPDHGIPKDAAHIRDLIGVMREARQKDENPLLVHCSAGCGRTGAIVAIDFVWTMLEEGKFDETFNLFELICNLRQQRMSIVQTAEQYALVNQVLRSLCEEWLARMASHTYVNVVLNTEQADQDLYVNINDLKAENGNDDEHIYDDTVPLKEQPKETKLSPTEMKVEEEQLVSKSPESGSGPKIVDVIRPSARVKSAAAYDNVMVVDKNADKSSKKAAPLAPVQQPADEQVDVPKHKTVIQIGTAAPKDKTSVGDTKVLYYQGNRPSSLPAVSPTSLTPPHTPLKHTSLSNPLTPTSGRISPKAGLGSSVASPGPNIIDDPTYSTVWPEGTSTGRSSRNIADPVVRSNQGPTKTQDPSAVYSPVIPKAERLGSSSRNTADGVVSSTQGPTKTNNPSAVYASVLPKAERFGSSSKNTPEEVVASPKQKSPPESQNPSAMYASVLPKEERGSSSSSKNVSVEGDYVDIFVSTPSPRSPAKIPATIPGFGERLPRVRGPVPQPQSWNK